MLGLRSARSRAILTGTLGLLLLAAVATTAAVHRVADTTLWPVIGLSALAFAVVSATVGVGIVSTTRPLATLRPSARAIAAGDSAARAKVSGPEEVASLARDLNAMTDALAAKTQEYIDTTNLTGVLILRVDKDNRVSLVNDAMCEFLGRARQEILGTPMLDYLHPEDALSTIRAIRKMVQTKGLVTGIVSHHVTPMGTKVTEWSGYPIFDEDGRYAGVHGTGRDISERKRAEEALRRREYELAERIKELDCLYGISGLVEKPGTSLEEILQGTAELIRESWQYPEATCARIIVDGQEFRTANFKETTWRQASNIRVGGQRAGSVEVYYLDKRPESNEGPFLKEERALINAVAERLGHITERKRAEQALRQSKERLRILFEFAPDAYYLHDLEGNFADGNRAAEELTGYKKEELIGKSLFDSNLFPPEQLPRAAATVAKLVQGLPTGPDEFTLIRKDGKHIAVETKGFPVKIGNQTLVLGIGRDISERKRAEEALRESEEKYRRVVQDSIDGIVIAQGLEMKFVNPALLKMFGCQSDEEMVSHSFSEFISPEYRELLVERGYAREKGQDEPEQYEYKALRKDGSEFDAEISVTRITYQGKPARQGIVRDVSERKRAEDALRESEGRYRLLAENVTDVIWTMDTNLRFTYMSPSVTRLRGYTVQEAMGQTLKQMLTSASLKIAKKAIMAEQAIEQMEEKDLTRSRTVEVEQTCKDGSTVWVEAKFAILRDPDGQAIGTLGISRDISKRKRAEEALRESEQRFHTLSDATFEGIAIHKKGKIVDANQRFGEIFGYEPSEVIGMHPWDFAAPESRDLVLQATVSGYEKPFELIGLRKDGTTLVVEACGKATRYGGETVAVAAIRDITQRKRAEEALRKTREDIESRVERRTREVNGYGLTFRELTVLHLVAAGRADKEIATVLGISPLTAHKHLANILDKMGAASRTEAGVRALREGLLD